MSEDEINHRAYIRILNRFDYQSPICIEAPRVGGREYFTDR